MEEEKEAITEETPEIPEVNTSSANNGGKGLAIASLVLGLVGLLLLPLPCGILAIVFSVVSKKKIKSGMATAGLVLGIIDIAWWIFMMTAGAALLKSLF